ncbi:MAG TPA: prolyl oligopeptidase family serine peptidase [Acidimicrobiales bacterium]
MGRHQQRRVGSRPYVEEDLEASHQRQAQGRQPRPQAQRGSLSARAVPLPPPAPRGDTVEVRHGVTVADPFRALEVDDDAEVRSWIKAQNARTDTVLRAIPGREQLRVRLTELLRAGTSVAPQVAGTRVFTVERWGELDQAVLVVRSATAAGRARTIVDPHRLTGDPTAAIDWFKPSLDGRLLAYGISQGGDERSTLQVVDVRTGDHLLDRIPEARAASVAWEPDGSGFLYTRYPTDDPGAADRGELRHVHHHQLGRAWSTDPLVWDALPDPTAWTSVSLSADGRWLLVHISVGWSRTDVHLVDRRTGARSVLIEGVEARTDMEIVGDQVIGVTTLDADRGRVVSAPLANPWRDHWCTIVPESTAVIEAVAATSSSLLVVSTEHAVARLDRYGHDGEGHRPIDLPGIGSVSGLDASPDRDHAFLSFTSFATPSTTHRWSGDDPSGSLTEWSHLAGALEHPVVVKQVRYPSADGTLVPMFLIRDEATVPGPDTPCILTGYGGFSITMSPAFSPIAVELCARGGVYAVAGLRGGAEEGEAWHRAGMREQKQNTFDDFVAAADWLVAEGHTSRERLAVRGGSNGGLLVGAAITQRPDLCRAAHAAVPLLDMVRYPEFLLGGLWVPEYGDPNDPDQFEWLLAYSPYHHVVDGTCYPATLLTTAAGDSRVHPFHARKMAARLQEATSCGAPNPVLLREERDAGHGQGKPVSLQAADLADGLGFLLDRIEA